VWRTVTRQGKTGKLGAALHNGIAGFRRRAPICLAANR